MLETLTAGMDGHSYIALFLFLVEFLSYNFGIHGTDLLSDCPGGRGTDTGVCLGHAGDTCNDTAPCDEDWGYSCRTLRKDVAKCSGKHNMRLLDVGETYFSLEWNDFMPRDYKFEYSARITEKYQPGLMTWIRQEIGRQSTYNFTYQSPGTVYFVSIGIWKDDNFTFYSETTEIFMVRTLDSSYCNYGDTRLHVGETVQEGCVSRCVCLTNGSLACQAVCASFSESGSGSKSGCVLQKSPDGCCLQRKCTPIMKNVGEMFKEKSTTEFASISVLEVGSRYVLVKIDYLGKPTTDTLFFCIKQSTLENSTHKSSVMWNDTVLEIRRLKPSRSYLIWLQYSLNDLADVLTQTVKFTTTAEEARNETHSKDLPARQHSQSNSRLYLVIIGSTTSVLVLLIIILIVMRRRKKGQQTAKSLSFHNQTFGFRLSFRTETLDHM